MAKFKKQTITLRGSGGIKAEIEAWDGCLALFTQSARNTLVRDAVWQGGEYYRTVFVPLKFSNYAKKFGYAISAKYLKRKNREPGGAVPLVWTGELRDAVLKGSRSRAVATAAKCYVDIIMPGPAYMNATEPVYKVMRSALPSELERVAEVVAKAMAELMEGTASKRGGAAPLRKLTLEQKWATSRSANPQRRKAPGNAPRKAA